MRSQQCGPGLREDERDAPSWRALAVTAGNTVKAGDRCSQPSIRRRIKQALDQAKSDLQAAEQDAGGPQDADHRAGHRESRSGDRQAEYQWPAGARTRWMTCCILTWTSSRPTWQTPRAPWRKAQARPGRRQQQTREGHQEQLDETAGYRSDSRRRTTAGWPAENYSDAYYQDRLPVAYNKMMDAEGCARDARGPATGQHS